MWPVLSALLPVRKFWPSDDDVVPSPQCSAQREATAFHRTDLWLVAEVVPEADL
jgi:hypothetical protein